MGPDYPNLGNAVVCFWRNVASRAKFMYKAIDSLTALEAQRTELMGGEYESDIIP